jgi:hypothetical protein
LDFFHPLWATRAKCASKHFRRFRLPVSSQQFAVPFGTAAGFRNPRLIPSQFNKFDISPVAPDIEAK